MPSSCSICCSSCGVSVRKNMSSAKQRLVRNSLEVIGQLAQDCTLLIVVLFCILPLYKESVHLAWNLLMITLKCLIDCILCLFHG